MLAPSRNSHDVPVRTFPSYKVGRAWMSFVVHWASIRFGLLQLLMHDLQLVHEDLAMMFHVLNLFLALFMRFNDESMANADEAPTTT
mmetsp:Transcript_25796/g.74492  ORF Transcript_25796/g.74492 Transcript_25796/m.74492 type:complete len:87 (-) Transcript_25796:930-1190(-)